MNTEQHGNAAADPQILAGWVSAHNMALRLLFEAQPPHIQSYVLSRMVSFMGQTAVAAGPLAQDPAARTPDMKRAQGIAFMVNSLTDPFDDPDFEFDPMY